MTSSTPRGHSFPWAAVVAGLAGLAVFQFFGNATRGYINTASVLGWWGYQWFDPASETEHGLLIVALSGWLGWRNLRRAPRGELGGAGAAAGGAGGETGAAAGAWPWAAFGAMAGGLALHAVGFAGQQTRVSIVALLVFVWGVARLGGGRRWSGAAAFPLGFLVFAVPVGALDTMGFWLRLWVIEASATLAHAAGIGVLQNGTQLVAPDGRYHYDVVAACSGMRSLTALAALSLLVGYLNFRAWWRRGALLAVCFPLVLVGNVARISSIVFAAQWGGQGWGERAHDVMGYGVFVIVLGGVLAAAALLQRWSPERAPTDRAPTESAVGRAEHGARGSAWGAAVAVVGLATGEMIFLRGLAAMPPRGGVGVVLAADGQNPVELPAFLGTEWIGRRAEVSAVERELLPPDTGFARKNYVAVADPTSQVFLSVVLSGRDRTSIHRPEICLVGQGWTITGVKRATFRGGAGAGGRAGEGPGTFPATVLGVRREVTTASGRAVVPHVVAYWFVGGDAVVGTHGRRLALDAWNRVAHARADRWAYVLMQTDAADGEEAALARMQAVLDGTLPAFQLPLAGR